MITYLSIPALVAFILKLALLAYSARSPTRNEVARPFLLLLLALTLLNVVEFVLLNYYSSHGLTDVVQACGFAYVSLLLLVGSVLLHLSLALSFPDFSARQALAMSCVYFPALLLSALLFLTDKLVRGFKPFLSYSILRDPGPWYFLVEALAVFYIAAILTLLIYGARPARPALLRVRNRLWLLGLAPMLALLLYVVVVDYFGWPRISVLVHMPIAVTFFLLITTYATHERSRPGGFYRFLYRLFDIESYLPWSKTHRRKSALYDRIQRLIANLGNLGSMSAVVRRISDTLQCPVVLRAAQPELAAASGRAPEIAAFPSHALQDIDRILVAHEIAHTLPRTHALMAQHKVAAIIPFHPYSQAASWMLLGESFSDHVYTPLDFERVKTLFDRLADHLLDEQMRIRVAVEKTEQERQALQQQIADTAERLVELEKEMRITAATEPNSSSVEIRTVQKNMLEQTAVGKKTLAQSISELESRLIAKALEQCSGNQAKAAELLGVRPNTLHYKIQRYRLTNLKKN